MSRLVLALATTAGLAAALSGSALAGNAFGQHVAECAHMALGPRDNPPAITCSHEGMTMTFPNFGAMVQHMRSETC